MNDDVPMQGPEGAAVFPLIPDELGVHPLLLIALHAIVFLDGSDDELLDENAAEEALQYVAYYLQRLSGAELQRVREDLQVLQDYAKSEKWPAEELNFLKNFLKDYQIGSKDQE